MVLVILRMALAAVFLLAAAMKITHRSQFRDTLTEFGLPGRAAPALTFAIPGVEAALAVALLPDTTAWWGASGMVAVLCLFTAVIAVNLARGKRPSCNCFGQLRSKPIGVATLVRNTTLGAAALYIAIAGYGHSSPAIMDTLIQVARGGALLYLLAAAALMVLGVLTWMVVNLLEQQGRLMLRIDGLEMRLGELGVVPGSDSHRKVSGLTPGSIAPAFTAQRLEGGSISSDEIKQAAKPIVLLFSDPNCGPCTAMVPDLIRWYEQYSERVSIWIVTRGTAAEITAKLIGLERHFGSVLVQNEREIANLFLAAATPSAVLLNPIGLVESHLAIGALEIAALISEVPSPASRAPERKPHRPSVVPVAKGNHRTARVSGR